MWGLHGDADACCRDAEGKQVHTEEAWFEQSFLCGLPALCDKCYDNKDDAGLVSVNGIDIFL